MSFTGEFSVKLNAKNQVTLPSSLREALFSMSDSVPIILFDRGEENYLELFPSFEWAQIQQRTEVEAKKSKTPELNRLLNRRAFSISMDEKGNGRMVIPPSLMNRFTSKPEVIFVGNTRKIEIWDAAAYRKFMVDDQKTQEKFTTAIDSILDY